MIPLVEYLNWPAPASVKACYTLRSGGASGGPFTSFNVAQHVGDEPDVVERNRQSLQQAIQQSDITWLQQVHGIDVINLMSSPQVIGDGAFTRRSNQVCCVMTADCLPVFFCDQSGQQVAVAHAGWRGLCEGVLQASLAQFDSAVSVLAYLGPAISQQAFEVGAEVKSAFCERYPHLPMAEAFTPAIENGKWMADLYHMARIILHDSGVMHIAGGDRCTYSEEDHFYSYRRDGQTGRMANLIWIEPV